MNTSFARHQSKFIAALIFLGVAAMIWMDEHRHSANVGQDAPTVTFKMLDGSPDVSLASLQGKPVVLDFWASWCGPCKASLPHVDALAKKYQGRAHVIAVNAEGEELSRQAGLRDQLKLTMPIATNGAEAAAAYRVQGLPTTIVLDRNGKVAASFVGSVAPSRIEHAINDIQ